MRLSITFKRAWVGELIGGAISAGAGLLTQHLANQRNKAETELAYQRNRQMIQEQNEFNSPASQVSRLQAAGLNPNLAYGADGALVGNQESSAEYDPAQYEPGFRSGTADPSAMIDSIVGIKEQIAQRDLADSQILLNGTRRELEASGIKVNEANARATLELLGLQKDYHRIHNDVERATRDNLIKTGREIEQRIVNLIADEQVLKEQYGLTRAQALHMNTQSLIAMLLYPGQDELNKASAAERRAMAAKAYEEMSYLGKYYDLASRDTAVREGANERGWSALAQDKRLTEQEQSLVREFNEKRIKQGYWQLGTKAFLGTLDAGVRVYQATRSPLQGMTMGKFYNPMQPSNYRNSYGGESFDFPVSDDDSSSIYFD